jgi:predicted RNase H-like nuclease (RuvC/YqgF family)
MKNFILTTIFLLISFLCKSQNDELPRYFVENGDTIGIILSVEQVQSLDNDAELLTLFKKMKINCDSLEVHYIKIINALNEKIAILEVQKADLINQIIEQKKLINNLKQSLYNCEEMYRLCRKESSNKDEEIKILKRELTRQKIKKIVSVGGNIGLAILATFLLVKM